MLSTKKASHIHIDVAGKKFYLTTEATVSENYEYKSKHFYLISDKEIPYPENQNITCIFVGVNNTLSCLVSKYNGRIKGIGSYHEIIASTDKELDIPNLLIIPDSFIKELVKINDIKSEIRMVNVKYIDEETILSSNNTIYIQKENWDKEELKLISACFADYCRLNNASTYESISMLWDYWSDINL